MIKRIKWYSITFLLICSLVFAVQFMHFLIIPANPAGVLTTINIPQGVSFSRISNILTGKRIINDKTNFKLLAYLMGATHNVKYGEYLFSSSMRPTTILEKLLDGEVVLHEVTIPEGYTDEQIAQTLEEKGLLDNAGSFMNLTHDRVFIAALDITAPSLEGFLYPDTYKLSKGLSPAEIIKKMVGQFKVVYTPELQQRAAAIGMSMLQVVTLASMIEKETSVPSERFLISAVFHNRLKLRMRLQSDPTVIYAMHITDDVITKKDLRTKDPYNTYTHYGLPPGPICDPGKESIIAALYPADVKYLYFVANNDGSHEFTRTLREHNHYVNLYQRDNKRR
ncbi:MAG: endolytic transglycosylase MltG [Deltaproteobacteria bacterium]|nr:endolytic transglycosylase MltG [Deltaproteobacteria bacterium]